MREELENIQKGFEVRRNLIALRAEIKEPSQKRALAYRLGGDFNQFTKLLEDSDPKVRKNAALILGEMECDDLVPLLYRTYEQEEQLFVKADYLKAMAKCDYKRFLPKLKERLAQVMRSDWEPADEKHVREETAVLRSMIFAYEKPQKHKFAGYRNRFDVILMTNRNFGELTLSQAENIVKGSVRGGTARILTEDIKSLMDIRTYTEILFPIAGASILDQTDPERAAALLADSELTDFLKTNHKGEGPFYFRVELKGKMTPEKKGLFIRRFASALERDTHGCLCNYPSGYELEIRLIEKQAGGYIPLLKLFTIPDRRFSYRQNALSTSISPVNAAIMMQLGKPWMKENAQVLDPFCGAGTMLIERYMAKKASPLYGVDIYPEAIEKARENTAKAGLIVNYINRDILDFRHEYLFDEIVSDMPAVTRTKDKGQIISLYGGFLEKAKELVRDGGLLLLYTPHPDVLENCMREAGGYETEESWVFNEREGSVFYIILRRDE